VVSTPVKNISQLELLFPIYINQININEYQQIIGGFNHLEKKKILVNGKDCPIYYGKQNSCYKPPTRISSPNKKPIIS